MSVYYVRTGGTMAKNEVSKTERVALRVTPAQRQLLSTAASLSDQSISEFVLTSTMEAAQNAVLDQKIIWMKPKDFEEFERRLAEPPKVNEGLARLFTKPLPWA